MKPQIAYEHVFTNYIGHKQGTNEYVYAFPEHWNTYTGDKEINLRSITVKCAARDLKMQNIYYKNDLCYVNIGLSLSLASNDDMSAANEKFKDAIRTKYLEYKDEIENIRLEEPTTRNDFGINDYVIEYEHSTNTFWIKIIKNDSDHVTYLEFVEADYYMSDDFLNMLGVKNEMFKKIAQMQSSSITREAFDAYMNDYSNVILKYTSNDANETQIKAIGFKNVWNRNTLFITSTLSTLAEDKFFTLSNVVHNPLKRYTINGYVTTFSIFIYDASRKNSVEIPNDKMDLVLIEMLMCAY